MTLTLKEVFMKEETVAQLPVVQLVNYTRNHATSLENVKDLAEQYEMFDEVLEHVAMEVATKQSPEERKYRTNQNVDSFFKFLLSKAKQALQKGLADYDELPGFDEYKAMLIEFYKENEKTRKEKELVHDAMKDYEAGMSPEKKKERELQRQSKFNKAMAAGEYGKLD